MPPGSIVTSTAAAERDENQCAPVSGNVRKCPVSENALTPRQLHAIRLLVAGRKDVNVARELNINPRTLHRWRTRHPAFRAELANRRTSLWDRNADQLGSMISRALRVLARQLRDPYDRTSYRAATALLRLAGANKFVARLPNDPTDPLDVARHDLLRERAAHGNPGAPPPTPDEVLQKFHQLLAECADDPANPEYNI